MPELAHPLESHQDKVNRSQLSLSTHLQFAIQMSYFHVEGFLGLFHKGIIPYNYR